MMEITLPLSVTLSRKKKDRVFICNLNHYRNTHYQILNQAKSAYKELVQAALEEAKGFIPPGPLCFVYTVYPSSKRGFDLGNVCSIIQKFTDDALIELGVIKDDNWKVISAVKYCIGYVDKDNPHATLLIKQDLTWLGG